MRTIGQQFLDLAAWEHEARDSRGRWTSHGEGVIEKITEPIGMEGARGNSREVSHAEFQRLAAEGRDRLHAIQSAPWSTAGLHGDWPHIKARTYAEVQKSWGGATIDPRSGRELPQGADKYAMSIKPTGLDTTSVPEHASAAEFGQAMDIALSKYGKQLAKGGSYLGVFHDDDLGRIDIDPVTVLDSLREVETVGAYTHAIGGAYRFSDGNGYWPPHVAEGASLSNSEHHWAGLGEWHRQATEIQAPHDEPEDQDGEPGGATGLATIGQQFLELSWKDAWRHETRNARGEWTHIGGGLTTDPGVERGFKGQYEGRDVLRPGMSAAPGRKPLEMPGRPDGAGTPDDPVDVQGDMNRAVDLMAAGSHVRLNSTAELRPLMDAINAKGDAVLKATGAEPDWDLGNISVRGTRLFNEQTLGIPRVKMPQLSGPAQPGSEAAILAHGANKFIELDPQFREQLRRDGVDVKRERAQVANLRATQDQLTATSVAGIARAAMQGNPKVLHMLQEPIWVSSDNYVIDGHHRWAAHAMMGNTELNIQRIGLPAVLAIPYANGFSAKMGIGGRALGNAKLVEGLATIGQQFLDFGWHDAWRHELRGPHGEWVKGTGSEASQALRMPSLLTKARDMYVGVNEGDKAAATKFLNKTADSVPGMFSSRDHLDWDRLPPTIYPQEQDPGVLAEIDWSGHMRMSGDVASGIAQGEDNPDDPVQVPAAYTVPLHEFIHATVPAGEHRDTNGDMAAYQDPTMAFADIEEGFTELGTIQHAADFFRANGLSDRTVKDSGGGTMDEMAKDLASPENIKSGTAWGRYKYQTAQAYNWLSVIAQQRTGKPENDPATQALIRFASDEINSVGTSAKPGFMASQVVGDMLTGAPGDKAIVDSAMQSILSSWGQEDVAGLVTKARQAARQRLEALQAERAAA